MAERQLSEIWWLRFAYAASALFLLILLLLPLETKPRGWIVGPDLLSALTFAWALRRPRVMSLLLVVAVMLTADLLLQRPPGLQAAIAVLLTELLRRRARRLRENTFATEWLLVGFALAALFLGSHLVLLITFVPSPPLSLVLLQLTVTILCYPLVTATGALLFGVRHTSPGAFRNTSRRQI